MIPTIFPIEPALPLPSRKLHNALAKALLGKSFDDVNRWLDQGAAIYGPHHRKLDPKHNLLGILLQYGLSPETGAGLVHLIADSTEVELKKRLRLLLQ